MSTFQERFNLAVGNETARRMDNGEPPLTKTMVWKAAKATSGAFTQWADGTTGMKLNTCFLVAPLLRVNPHWLFDESRPMNDPLASVGDPNTASLPQPTEEEFALVKQLDLAASCGNGRFSEHVVVKGGLAFKRSSLRDINIKEEHARIIYADGDSMEPSIGHGRVVLIDTNDKRPVDNKIFLICDPDGSILLKRLVREFHPGSGEMRWIMRSDNPNKTQYPDKLLPDDERTHIVGRAVWTDKML